MNKDNLINRVYEIQYELVGTNQSLFINTASVTNAICIAQNYIKEKYKIEPNIFTHLCYPINRWSIIIGLVRDTAQDEEY